ncbi:MAG TPA: hypothetical protein ENN90_05690 [Mariniphaga anaerophila]|uniref:Carbohydrate-binding domain-containing protein n=1 Tax=Mariniphaga anaerophila TaxID=1484053 RepID=A0A831LGN8_9BACT|nr:hypothetical protein [Mariniphaga anaerophila]
MVKIKFLISVGLALLLCKASSGQNNWQFLEKRMTPARSYVVYKTPMAIQIDGVASESVWADAEWTEFFVDIEGEDKPLPTWQTRVKMLWDDRYLYFFAELEEPHVWAYYKDHDLILYHENDFEIFIDPNGNTHHYFEFEFNAQNTLFDLFMTRPYRNGGIPLISWDAPGIKHAVSIDGTLNDPTDEDVGWTLEVAVPFEALRTGIHTKIPKNGETWKVNFSRVQWETEIKDGKYHRKRDTETGRILPEKNWVWSPQGLINMHYPERWGNLQFSEKPVGESKVGFIMPGVEVFNNYLWRIYYKQMHYRQNHGHFANLLSELEESDEVITSSGEKLTLELHATNFQFFITGKTADGMVLNLDNHGLFQHK